MRGDKAATAISITITAKELAFIYSNSGNQTSVQPNDPYSLPPLLSQPKNIYICHLNDRLPLARNLFLCPEHPCSERKNSVEGARHSLSSSECCPSGFGSFSEQERSYRGRVHPGFYSWRACIRAGPPQTLQHVRGRSCNSGKPVLVRLEIGPRAAALWSDVPHLLKIQAMGCHGSVLAAVPCILPLPGRSQQ